MSCVEILNYLSVVFGALSAVLWWCSARVKFPFGFDMDAELNKAMKKASKLNALAATSSAIAIFCQATVFALSKSAT